MKNILFIIYTFLLTINSFYCKNITKNTLPFSVIEAKKVSEIFDGDILLYDNANYYHVINSIEDYDIIHFSLHSKANLRKPLLSNFLLWNNEHLFISDIYPLHLKAKISVLSGCSTGLGKVTGEGVLSFSRAFLFAGSKSVIPTLWEIDDFSTSKIIIDFYNNLIKGFPKDIALQKAKLNYISKATSKSAAPVFWAAPIVTGNPNKIVVIKKNTSQRFFLPVVILLLALFLFFYNKQKKLHSGRNT